MKKYKWLSIEQKKVFQYLARKYYLAGDMHASETAYRDTIGLSQIEIQKKVREIENGGISEEDRALLEQIKSRYTDSELQLIASGAGVYADGIARVDTPTHHHKIGVISDTHIGSKYAPAEWLEKAFDTMEAEGCECVLHAGDLTEGMKVQRIGTQMYEIEKDCLGYPAMRDAAVKACERCRLPLYIISGNHDLFFQDDADIVADVCERVPTMHYLGKGLKEFAPLSFNGAKILLFHGLDGFSNTRLKNLASSAQVALKGINLVLAGHVHKFEVKYIDGCYMVHVPTLQKTSPWMQGKKLYADCGFLVLDFDVKDRKIINLKTQFFNLCD